METIFSPSVDITEWMCDAEAYAQELAEIEAIESSL